MADDFENLLLDGAHDGVGIDAVEIAEYASILVLCFEQIARDGSSYEGGRSGPSRALVWALSFVCFRGLKAPAPSGKAKADSLRE